MLWLRDPWQQNVHIALKACTSKHIQILKKSINQIINTPNILSTIEISSFYDVRFCSCHIKKKYTPRTWQNTVPVYSTFYSTFYCHAVKCKYQNIGIDNTQTTPFQEYTTSRSILLSEIPNLTIYCMNWSHAVVWWYGFTHLGCSLLHDFKHDVQMSNANILTTGNTEQSMMGYIKYLNPLCKVTHNTELNQSRWGLGWWWIESSCQLIGGAWLECAARNRFANLTTLSFRRRFYPKQLKPVAPKSNVEREAKCFCAIVIPMQTRLLQCI